jgi:hypothetical protein
LTGSWLHHQHHNTLHPWRLTVRQIPRRVSTGTAAMVLAKLHCLHSSPNTTCLTTSKLSTRRTSSIRGELTINIIWLLSVHKTLRTPRQHAISRSKSAFVNNS